MTEKQLQNFFKTYKRGCYTSIVKQSEKNGYIKRVAMVVRFVNYFNIKTIKEKNTQPAQARPYEKTIIPHILKLNINTNNLLLCVYATNNEKQRAKTQYFYNDIEISEQAYYQGINEKKRINNNSVVFTFKACEVVRLGGAL